MQTNYDSRREYIRKIKESFAGEDPPVFKGRNTAENGFDPEDNESGVPKSFWKLRFLLAVLCFIGFFMLHQTDYQWKGISEETIAAHIQENYDLETIQNCFQEVTHLFK